MKRLISTNSSFVTALLFATALAGQPAFAGDECGAEGGAEGDLYVADSGAQNRVLQYDGSTGDFVCEFVHDGSGGLTNPNGVTFGPNGNLFVASSEIGNHAVLEYDGANGDFIRKFASDCELDNPVGLAFGPNGNLFVACQCSSSVIEYDGMTGACVNTHCPGLPVATGLAFDSAGDLFVASQSYKGSGSVWKLDLGSGTCTPVCSGLGVSHGVLVRDNGNLLVADRAGNTIEQCDPDTGTLGVFAERCELDEPYGMAFGPNGNLFVASLMNGKVIEYRGTDGNCVGTFANIRGAPTFLEFKSTQPPDCNNNGIPDVCDVDCAAAEGACDVPDCGQSQDCNNNGVPDECEKLVDTDGDGIPDECDNCPDHANENQFDCDQDGIGNVCAIAQGFSEDCNGDGIPDSCELNCPADLNGDGVVDAFDLAFLLGSWGPCEE